MPLPNPRKIERLLKWLRIKTNPLQRTSNMLVVLDVHSAIQYGIIDFDLFPRWNKNWIEIMSINQLGVPTTSLSFHSFAEKLWVPASKRLWEAEHPTARCACIPERDLLTRRNGTWSGSRKPARDSNLSGKPRAIENLLWRNIYRYAMFIVKKNLP